MGMVRKNPRVFSFLLKEVDFKLHQQKLKVRFSHFQTIESSMEVAKKKISSFKGRANAMIVMECLECVL